jgi:HSP20 family protein
MSSSERPRARRRTTAEQTVPTPTTSESSPTREPTRREPTRAEEMYVPPPVDIYEDEQGLVVVADLPGAQPDALDVRVEQGILTLQARATHVAPAEPVYREYELVGFFRQFQLPEEVDVARITADFKNGVLTLRLPRAERAQPRRIQVQAQ